MQFMTHTFDWMSWMFQEIYHQVSAFVIPWSLWQRGDKPNQEISFYKMQVTKTFFILKGVDLIDSASIFLLRTINHCVVFMMCILS